MKSAFDWMQNDAALCSSIRMLFPLFPTATFIIDLRSRYADESATPRVPYRLSHNFVVTVFH